MKTVWCGLLGLSLLCGILAEIEPPAAANDDMAATQTNALGVTIVDDGLVFEIQPPSNSRIGRRYFHFGGMNQKYTLALNIEQQRQTNETWIIRNSNIGMAEPNIANWYYGGFMRVFADTVHIQQNCEPQIEVVETGRQGVLDITWDHPLVTVRARFIAEPNADYFLMELHWEPKRELKTLTAEFVCFPHFFYFSSFKGDEVSGKKRFRQMVTAERVVDQTQTIALNLPSEWWQIFQDKEMDKDPSLRRWGPCGLAFMPDDVNGDGKTNVRIDDYQVAAFMDLKVSSGRARFALWDFSGVSNATAKARVSAEAESLQKRMKTGSWLPVSMSAFDLAVEQRRLDALKKQLGWWQSARIKPLRSQLASLSEQYAAFARTSPTIQAERDWRQMLATYRTSCWRVEHLLRESVRVLALAGPFASEWKIEPTVKADWGPDAMKSGNFIPGPPCQSRISYFPSTLEEFFKYDVVILADFPKEPLTSDKCAQIAEYVKAGGGLMILGGSYAYGAGAFRYPVLAPILPVIKGGIFDLRPMEGDASLAITRAGVKKIGKIKEPLGAVCWQNRVAPKPESEIWITMGNEPFAVFSTAGEGRVLTVLGTVLGENPVGGTAFYDSPGWPELLKRMILYLAKGRGVL